VEPHPANPLAMTVPPATRHLRLVSEHLPCVINAQNPVGQAEKTPSILNSMFAGMLPILILLMGKTA
jgi:hypothetical protein